jgi:hypothetical protein
VAEPGRSVPFEKLDFLYVPSRDVAEDLAFFGEVLGGQVVFAIDPMGHGSLPSGWPRILPSSC